MTNYPPHKEQVLEQAKESNLFDYVKNQGYNLKKESANSVKIPGYGGLVLFLKTNSWYWYSEQKGGNTLDFLTRFEGRSFVESINMLLGERGVKQWYGDKNVKPPSESEISARKQIAEMKRTAALMRLAASEIPFELPKTSKDIRNTFAYLIKKRNIAPEVVQHFVNSKHIMQTAKYNNCMFVGFNEDTGVPEYASVRGTITPEEGKKPYKQDIPGSKKAHCFRSIGTSENLYVFEAPVDLLSFISLHKDKNWQKENYVALGGVGTQALDNLLEHHPNIKNIALCLDNDKYGQNAAQKIALNLEEKGYRIKILAPKTGKDWNEHITNLAEHEKFSSKPREPPIQNEQIQQQLASVVTPGIPAVSAGRR